MKFCWIRILNEKKGDEFWMLDYKPVYFYATGVYLNS